MKTPTHWLNKAKAKKYFWSWFRKKTELSHTTPKNLMINDEYVFNFKK